jgi:ABC-type microcin C transport system permease subunit YejE
MSEEEKTPIVLYFWYGVVSIIFGILIGAIGGVIGGKIKRGKRGV